MQSRSLSTPTASLTSIHIHRLRMFIFVGTCAETYSPICARSSAEDSSDGWGVGVEEVTGGLVADSAGAGGSEAAGVGGAAGSEGVGGAGGAVGGLTPLLLIMLVRCSPASSKPSILERRDWKYSTSRSMLVIMVNKHPTE